MKPPKKVYLHTKGNYIGSGTEWILYRSDKADHEYHLAPQWRDAEKDPPDKDGDYHCLWDGEVFIGAYTIVHGFENNCEKWQEIYRPLPIESEGE